MCAAARRTAKRLNDIRQTTIDNLQPATFNLQPFLLEIGREICYNIRYYEY